MKIKAAIQELPVVGPTATTEMSLYLFLCVFIRLCPPGEETLGCHAKAEILLFLYASPLPMEQSKKEKGFPCVWAHVLVGSS